MTRDAPSTVFYLAVAWLTVAALSFAGMPEATAEPPPESTGESSDEASETSGSEDDAGDDVSLFDTPGTDSGNAVATDGGGNVYVAGQMGAKSDA